MSQGAQRRVDGVAVQASARQQARARRGGGRGGTQLLEQQLQQHIDREDCRIKNLTEAVLYDFLPCAIRAASANTPEPISELTEDRCWAVASACLAVATLLNAPPGFLEFLLCMPWAQLPEVYSDWGDAGRLTSSIASLELLSGPEQQSHLVNWPLGQGLVDCVMDFLYRDEYRDSLPPMMALGPGEFVPGNGVAAGPVQRAVHAMLDGATALHCAAARGNPAQVDHLLMCGADPLSRNAAGELPMELVPRCADPSSGLNATCCCMGRGDQEAWECRSRVARMFILRRCVGMVRIGVLAWMRLMVLCLLCLMGLWGAHTSLVRPALEARGKACWQARRMKARARAKDTLNAMRSAVAEGREALSQLSGSRRLSRSSSSSPNGDPPLQGTLLLLYGVKVREPFSPVISGPSITVDVMCAGSNEGSLGDAHPHLNTSSYDSRCAQSRQASRAYAAFTSAVAVLQRISAQQGTNDIASVLVPEARHLPRKDWAEVEIPLEEQAAVYAGLAQAAVAVHDGCGCAGCEAVASSAVDSAVRELMGLFDAASAAWKDGGSEHEASQQLAGHLAAAIHLRATLLLRTDARRSATQSAIWRAQQCVAEWSRMRRLKARSSLSPDEVPLEVECLESWAATAAADVLLTEALLGEPVPPLQPLSEAAAAAVQRDASGALCLGQPTSKALLEQLKTALNVAGPLASEHIRVLAEGVAARATEEIQVGEHLRTLLRQRSSGGAGPTPEQLAAAAAAAAQFPSLADEVAQAATMQERWVQRNAAQEQLNGIVDAASAPAPLALLQECMADITAGLEAFRAEINRRLHELEAAVEGARVASISVSRAKKLQKDLQAQMAAVEAAVKLDEALHQTKAGSGAIKAGLSRAEDAAAAATGGAGSFTLGSDLLAPRIHAARSKVGVEKAAEALSRAVSTCRTVADLPKLEAAILGARKVGAHEIDADAYHAATELRVKLDAASKARTALENALRTLQRGGRPEDVAEVERLIENATAFGELLASDAAKSKEAVAQWQAASVAESKLERVLQEGGGAAALSKAIKDATAAGVKVTEARRILKLMQALEAAIAAAHAEGGSALNGLQSKIQAAVSGGVPHAIVADARRTLHRLTLADVRSELDAALKMTRATEQRPVSQRFALLKAVLERVDAVLAMGDGTGAEGDDHGATEERADAHTATSPSLQLALSLGSTDSSHDGVLLALPKGKLRSQGSFASQVASSSAASTPTWAYAAAAAGGGLADCEAIVVRMKPVGDVVAVWFEPAPGVDELSSSECEDDALPPEGEGDDEAAVRHMARVARRRLNREGREHQRLEREKAEEARVRRELQAKEKAAREVADRERAERARAERAERKAALEAQKAERRERERAQRLEREKARQGREAQAREHFLLLQRQRRELAEQARAAQIAQLLAAQSVQHGFFGAPSPEEPSAQWLSVPGHSPDPSIDLSATGVLGILEEDPLADAGAAAAAAAQGAAFEATSEGFATNPASLAGTTSDAASAGQSTLWSSQDGKGLGDAAEEAFPGPNARLFGDLGGATWLSRNTAGLGLDVPVSSSAPPTTGGELLTSSGLLWGSTGGGMDGSGASAFGLPGVGANQGWSSGQGSAATSAMVNTSLAAADREAQLSKALDAAKALLKVQQAQQAHQAQRVCKYYAQGYCREGERCRFVHSLQNNGLAMNALQPPVTLPMQQGSSVSMGSAPTSNAVAASSFAFGAPGSKEFSSFGGVSSGQRPAMSGASGAQLGSSFLLGSGGAANSLSGGGGLGPFGSLPLDSQTTMGGLGGGLGGPLNVRSLPEQTSALATAVGMSTPHISGVASTGGTPRGGGLHWGSGAFGAGQDGSDAGPGVNASLFADFLFSNGAQDGLSGADKGTNGGL